MDNSPKHDSSLASSVKLRVIELDSVRLGVAEDQIAAISDWSDPAPLPFAPESVLGVVCIHGRMMTLLELGGFLNANTKERPKRRTQIVSLRGDEQLALAVDAADELIEVQPTNFENQVGTVRFIGGKVRHADVEIQLILVEQLFASVMQGRERRLRQV